MLARRIVRLMSLVCVILFAGMPTAQADESEDCPSSVCQEVGCWEDTQCSQTTGTCVVEDPRCASCQWTLNCWDNRTCESGEPGMKWQCCLVDGWGSNCEGSS